MKYITEHFNSIEHLIKSNETRPINSVFKTRSLASNDHDGHWAGTDTYDEAIELIKNGFTEPLDKIKRGVEAKLSELKNQKTAVKNDVVGYAPCVPNAIMGIPQSMINKETIAKKSKIVTIVYDSHANCGYSADEFIKAGIATLTIINSLEAQGYRVELKDAFFSGRDGNKEMVFATVTLKDWRQPLDLKKMTFPFCNAAMLRRIGFRYLERQPEITASYYGYSQPNSNNDYAELVSELRTNKTIKDHEKYINISLCKEHDYNPRAIAQACGLNI